MDICELVDRLYDRCRMQLSVTEQRDLDRLVHEDIAVAAIDLVAGAIDDGQLESAETTVAIELARNGEFLKSSRWLLDRLMQYQSRHSAA